MAIYPPYLIVEPEVPISRRSRRMSARMRDQMNARMNEMFGMALDVVYDELDAGNVRVSMWFVEQHGRKTVSRITERMKLKVKTMADMERASEEAVLAGLDGRLTFSDVREIQEALARHAVLSGMRTIGELGDKITALETKSAGTGTKYGLNGSTPTWGRLSEKATVIEGGKA